MSEDPTRMQQPRDPADRGRGEVYEEREVEAGPSRTELADQARGSRNWAYGAAFLGILAAGLAAVAIIFATGDDGGGGEGASRSSVSNLREDVEALQEQLDEVEGQTEGTGDLAEQVADLDSTVSELNSAQESNSEQLSELEQRVEEVAQDAAQGGSGNTGDGGATQGDSP